MSFKGVTVSKRIILQTCVEVASLTPPCVVTLALSVPTVTQDESNRTWGRSALFKPEEFDDAKKGIKKKGRTWGPSSVQSKERPAAAER